MYGVLQWVLVVAIGMLGAVLFERMVADDHLVWAWVVAFLYYALATRVCGYSCSKP